MTVCRSQDRCFDLRTATRSKDGDSKSEKVNDKRTTRQNVANFHYFDQDNASGSRTHPQRGGNTPEKLSDSAKRIETTGSKTTRKHVVIGGIDVTSRPSSSKQFVHHLNQCRHRSLPHRGRQGSTHVRSRMSRASQQAQDRPRNRPGARCQSRNRGEETEPRRNLFDSMKTNGPNEALRVKRHSKEENFEIKSQSYQRLKFGIISQIY